MALPLHRLHRLLPRDVPRRDGGAAERLLPER